MEQGSNRPTEIFKRFDVMRRLFVERLPDRMSSIIDNWQEASSEAASLEALRAFQRRVSSLAVSGATFGVKVVSQQSRQLETFLNDLLTRTGRLALKDREYVQQRLADLATAVQEPEPLLRNSLKSAMDWFKAQSERDASLRLIFYAGQDDDFSQDLLSQLACFGYSAELFPEVEAMDSDLRVKNPQAILIDAGITGGVEQLEALRQYRERVDFVPPVIALTAGNDLRTQLASLRAGAASSFSAPIEVSALVDSLDRLTGLNQDEPFRVLMVTDKDAEHRFASAIFKAVGIKLERSTEPLELMGPISEFRPDLLLVDLRLPGCTGLELASLLRQRERTVLTPLIIVADIEDKDCELEVLSVGAEDFLVRPVSAETLVRSVTSRIRRARQLKALAQYDSLTGLLKHSAHKAQLELECQRAERSGQPLSLALLDIDYFKTVNDNYGHLVGDQILIVLARLLKQRLRRTDIIGRIGGDEIAILLPDTDGGAAKKVLSDVCGAFGRLQHHAGERSFCVTLSCGVAEWRGPWLGNELTEAADKALYEAKDRGRNQVRLYKG